MLFYFKISVWIFGCLGLVAIAKGDSQIWAVLVAASNEWGDYRHQAGVCHAYHVLKNHGVAEKNIITMMYDNIAHNTENPFKGQIFNSPDKKDVYNGVNIDYRGDDVNAHNFLAILQGNSTAANGGKVLQSGAKDKVFIFFSDHGDSGVVCFPENELLTAKDLHDTLRQMHDRHMYSELTFYLETCLSGSMFEGILQPELNIYAVTASNSKQSHYACYCNSLEGLPCLGGQFSVGWMSDSDQEDLQTETLQTQFQIVQQATVNSTVCSFGQLNISSEHVANFQEMNQALSRDFQQMTYFLP